MWAGHLAATRCLTSSPREARLLTPQGALKVIFWHRAVIPGQLAGQEPGAGPGQSALLMRTRDPRCAGGGQATQRRGGHRRPSLSQCALGAARLRPSPSRLGARRGLGRVGRRGERRRVFPASSFRSPPSVRKDPAPSAPTHRRRSPPLSGPSPAGPGRCHSLAGNRSPARRRPRPLGSRRPTLRADARHCAAGSGAVGCGHQGAPGPT